MIGTIAAASFFVLFICSLHRRRSCTKPLAQQKLSNEIPNYKELSFFGKETLINDYGLPIPLLHVGRSGVVIKAIFHGENYWEILTSDATREPGRHLINWYLVAKHFPDYREEIELYRRIAADLE